MAVNLSPVGGVAAQFLDNNGNVLSGGKLYTYSAGTTTPVATFTSSLGVTAHTNPIVLDAAGRVPSGEIWLTDGVIYKFVLKTSADVLIATYDNITGINSNFVNFTAQQEIQTATAGQTVFDLTTMQYQPGTNSLTVYVDGVNQYGPGSSYAYLETDSDTVTFVSGLHEGAEVKFTTATQVTGNATDACVVAYDPPFTGAVATTVCAKLAQTVSVKDFGAVGDGVTDDTAAISAAHATGKPVFYPYGTYKFVGYFPVCEGGIIGEGWSNDGGAKQTSIVFYNCTSTTSGAINLKETQPKTAFFRIENIRIRSSSWDSVTGCLGHGIDVGNSPVIMNNVYVSGFKEWGIYMHHDATSNGPYDSLLVNVFSAYNGTGGLSISNGANSITLINYKGYWNGAPSFGVAPSALGVKGDGLKVATDDPSYPTYTPQNINIIGGDCSYNARHGWNFSQMADSACVNPGYAELNYGKQAYIGSDVFNTKINFSTINGGIQEIQNNQTYVYFYFTNAFYLGGKQFHPAADYSLIANPTLPDVDFNAGPAYINAPVNKYAYLSRTNDFASFVALRGNSKPDGSSVNPATETVASIRPSGPNSGIGIGNGANHLEIKENYVALPITYYQKINTGWGAEAVVRRLALAAPTTGTWKRGDITYNAEPSAGGYIGWVCVVGGTPGTWKAFGAIVP